MRSLADDLRQRSDEQLAALVTSRPDLVHPVPADVAALGLRAGSPASVALCLRAYDTLTLHVALAAALAPDEVRADDLTSRVAGLLAVPDARARVTAAVERLRRDALLWGSERALHLVGAARDALVPSDRGPAVAALDPVVAGYARDPSSLRDLLEGAPPAVRDLVDRLAAGPVVGSVADAQRTPDQRRSPVDWLLAHRILVPVGDSRVVLPAEVVAILRGAVAGDPALAVTSLVPPAPAGAPADPARVDAGAVGAVLDHLHRTADLARLWATSPPTRLRTGGVSLRDVTVAARALRCDEATAMLVIEVAEAAGLVAADSHDVVTFLPTRAFDAWMSDPPAIRHALLLRAWLRVARTTLAGERPLAAERILGFLPALRRDVLAALARHHAPMSDADVVADLDWWAPRRSLPDRPDLARMILAEATTMGILVGGVLTTAGRRLLDDDESALAAALARGLPPVVDELVMQADLTAIVPGLPAPELAALMDAVADVESVGAASVHRFSAASIRRALDQGRTADDLISALARRGSVPQPLAYLITDTARRHASLRIGAAATYVRCDDPAQLAGILADPAAAALAMTRLADTVLVCAHPPEVVLERLRRLGHAPVAEVGLEPAATEPRRARARAAQGEPSRQVSASLAAAAVRAMRAGDRPGHAGGVAVGVREVQGHPVAPQPPAEVIAALRAAIAEQRPTWIGYADPTGTASDRHVEPLQLAGGYLTAMDLRSESIQTFALARITGVEPG